MYQNIIESIKYTHANYNLFTREIVRCFIFAYFGLSILCAQAINENGKKLGMERKSRTIKKSSACKSTVSERPN